MKYIRYVKDLVISKKILGLNTCIICNGERESISFGYKSVVPNIEINDIDTLYDVASLTKVLTILPIICRLVDNHEISFNTRVKDILPEFKYGDITIYDVLIHQSGLPSSVNMKDKPQNKEAIISEIFKLDKEFDTGSKTMYSDIGYIVLGLLLERIYNLSLSDIANTEVFGKLNMNNTMYNPIDVERCAPTEYIDKTNTEVYRGVVHDWKARMLEGVAGHAGVFSTADDMGNYMEMVLNRGYYNNKQFISEELIELWFKTLAYEESANRFRSLWGITGNNRFVINGGSNTVSFHGFSGPSISLDRENNIGICLMANSVHPLRENKDNLNSERQNISRLIYSDYTNKKTL